MAKYIIFLMIIFLTFPISSKDKTYTESEVNEIIKEEVSKKMDRINERNLVGFSKSLLKKEERLKNFEMILKRREEELKINQKELDQKINLFVEKQKKIYRVY